MRDMEEAAHLYEQYLKISSSKTWTLQDLLQYALELILSEEEFIPTETIDELYFAREGMLNEIDRAICLQKKNKSIPPMPLVASSISCLGAFLKEEELDKLGKLLNSDYRGKRGQKDDTEETRRDDIERMFKFRDLRKTMPRDEAVASLAKQEKIHERSAERAIGRGEKYFCCDSSSAYGDRYIDMLDSLKKARQKLIKDEIQKLLPSSKSRKNPPK